MARPTRGHLLCLLVIGPILALRVEKSKDQDPHKLLDEADHLATLYNWPKAEQLYTQAEALFTKSHDSRNTAYAEVGRIWAQASLSPSPALDRDIEGQLKSPTVQSDRRFLLRCLLAKAALDQEKNELIARSTWEEVLEAAKAADDKRWQARAQAELGINGFIEGDVATATAMLKDAMLSMFTHGDLAGSIYYGSVIGNGIVEAGQPDSGLKYCETALLTSKIVPNLGFPYMAYQGKARALNALNRGAEAKQLLDVAVQHAKADGNFIAQVQLLIVLGTQAKAADRNQAIEYLRQAVSLSKDHHLPHEIAWGAWELANVYRDAGDMDHALQSETQAIQAMREVQDKYHLPLDLPLLAELQTKKGDIVQAERTYQQASDVLEGMLANVSSRQIESSLIGTESQLYLGHFELAATRLHNVEEAFNVIEAARGRAIADALRSEPETAAHPDPAAQSAKKEISRIQVALLREENPDSRRKLLDELFQTEQVLAPVGRPQTILQRETARSRPVMLAKLRASLRPDEMVLEYVLDDPKSYCVYTTRGRAGIATLPAGRNRIEGLVNEYLAQIKAKQTGAQVGQELYSILLRSIPGMASKLRLIIVPDGKLNLLPFDALTNDQQRFVLESHVVSYTPSATVLYLIRTSRETQRPTLSFLGMGDVQYAQNQSPPTGRTQRADSSAGSPLDPFNVRAARLSEIPESRDEVIAASRIFGKGTTLLLGSAATEAKFKSEPLGDFAIIHIAAHGIASPQFPERAALVLGADPNFGDDGLLQVREIRDLTLKAQLVTLSGCDTGAGQLLGEEGIANLVRAFLFAGARSVLASLWTAPEQSTQSLMVSFYRHLADGEDEGDALRRAKVDLIKQFGGEAMTYYWAGFTLSGNGSAKTRRTN